MGRLDNEQHTASDTQNTVQPRDCSLLNLGTFITFSQGNHDVNCEEHSAA